MVCARAGAARLSRWLPWRTVAARRAGYGRPGAQCVRRWRHCATCGCGPECRAGGATQPAVAGGRHAGRVVCPADGSCWGFGSTGGNAAGGISACAAVSLCLEEPDRGRSDRDRHAGPGHRLSPAAAGGTARCRGPTGDQPGVGRAMAGGVVRGGQVLRIRLLAEILRGAAGTTDARAGVQPSCARHRGGPHGGLARRRGPHHRQRCAPRFRRRCEVRDPLFCDTAPAAGERAPLRAAGRGHRVRGGWERAGLRPCFPGRADGAAAARNGCRFQSAPARGVSGGEVQPGARSGVGRRDGGRRFSPGCGDARGGRRGRDPDLRRI